MHVFTQKNDPSYSLDSPMLEFEVLGDRNNYIDVQRTHLEIVACTVQINGKVLRFHATEAAQRGTPYVVINSLSSFFPNARCL